MVRLYVQKSSDILAQQTFDLPRRQCRPAAAFKDRVQPLPVKVKLLAHRLQVYVIVLPYIVRSPENAV